jgi:hypothetical protein
MGPSSACPGLEWTLIVGEDRGHHTIHVGLRPADSALVIDVWANSEASLHQGLEGTRAVVDGCR